MEYQAEKSVTHDKYRELGGLINERDYISALEKAKKTTVFGKSTIRQAENIAKYAGIIFNNLGDIDPKVKLYAVLRIEKNLKGINNHHSQMSDQRLFAEVLLMFGDIDSLNKMIVAYPNISF